MPPFDGIGANEYIVDVTHDAVDFISARRHAVPWELNIWYHTLNCGFRDADQRRDRLPVHLRRARRRRALLRQARRQARLRRLVRGDRAGRSYVSDGKSHLMDFTRQRLRVGSRRQRAEARRRGTRDGRRARRVPAARAAPAGGRRPIQRREPYWTAEHARIGGTREVPVEASSTARSVATQPIVADGDRARRRVRRRRSSARAGWRCGSAASAHTNPVFVRGRRQADPRVAPQRRVVPEGGRSVLVAEGAEDPAARARRGGARLRPRPRGLSRDCEGVARSVADGRQAACRVLPEHGRTA